MRSQGLFIAAALLLSCAPPAEGPKKSSASVRADRRAYDGAPPVIPHAPMGSTCTECHNARGVEVPGVGFAPASPHDETKQAGRTARCVQCHVFRQTEARFVDSAFTGLAQDLRRGDRLYDGAPPRIPHATLMRENCAACHTGTAAREEIRSSHPERTRCRQCHVEVRTKTLFPGDG